MELELGFKVTRTREDVSSSVDFRFSKDPFGPLVLSRETDSRFIIIIHIKGFKKEGIEIDINKEGDRITIEGRKPVEEMVMIRWMAWRKEVEFRVFKKVFRIPDTVVLDEIKARFDDDDATLTITMPKRVKGISGFNIEEEEEERVDKGEVEEQSTVWEESDAHSEKFETEIQREEGFGENESQVLGEEQKEEDETGDDYLEKNHQIDEQDKILERIEDEKQLAESNEDSSLRKPPDIEGHEQRRHNEQDKKQKRVDEAESNSDDFGSTAFEEIEEQEPDHEQLDRTSKSGAKEKKTTDGDGDGLSKDQGIKEEPERRNDKRKIKDIVQVKGEEDKKKTVKKEIKRGDSKVKSDAKMGELFASNFADTAMNTEDLESDEELDKTEKLVEKKYKQEENAEVGAQSEDISLTNPTDFEGRDSHAQTRHEEQENSQHSETEILREEEFGERESQVLGEEQKDIEETDDDNLDKINQIEEQEEEKIVADSNKENEDSSLRKLPDIQERESHEQTRHEEQERVVEQQDSQAETNSNDFGCRAFEDQVGEQKPHVTKSREMEKEKIDDDDVGLRKVQEIEEPEIHNEESKKSEGETSGDERNKTAKMDIKNRDAKEEVDGKMGEGFRPNIDRTQVVAENDIGETETKADEFESDKLKADEVHKIHELVEKKEDDEENANLRGKSKDISLKLQENEEQQSKGQKRQDKQEMIKELVEEKTPKAEPNTGNDIPKPVQAKTSDKGKEEKKSIKMEIKTGEAKEEVDAKMGGGFAPNIAETATKFEEFESEKLDSDEVDKIQKLVEKTEDEEGNHKVGTQSEDISSRKLQEIGEQQFQGPKRQKKQEKIRELVEEQTLEAKTNIGNDIPKPVQEIKELQKVETLEKTGDERKARKVKKKSVKMEINNEDVKEEVDEKMGQGFEPNVSETDDDFESNKLEADEVDKIHALFEKQQDEEEIAECGRQTEDISLKELQEIEEQQFHGQKRQEKQEKIKELVEEKTLEEETNIGNINPKPVAERSEGKHKIQNKFQDDTKNQPEEYKEKFTETNDPGTRKVQEIIRKQELNEPARSEKESKIRELVKSKTNDEGKEKKIAEKETKAETYVGNDILKPVQEISEGKHKIPELSQEETKNQPEEYLKKIKETGKKTNDAGARKLQEIKQELNEPARSEKESKTQELVKNKRNEIAETETREQDSNRPKIIREQEKIQELAEEKTNFSKNGKAKDKDEIAEKKTEFCVDDDDISSKFRDVEQQDSDAMKGQEEKDMIQELALEEKVSDGGKGIVAVLDTKVENNKSKKVQEIDGQQLHEEDRYGKQFQKLIVGEVSGRGEVDDIKIIEEEKEIRDSSRKGQETAKTDSELHNNREVCRSEEKKYDRPEKIEQELVNLNSQLEQDNVEDGEKTQEPVEEEIKDCREEEGSGESKTKTDDDVVRKVQGVKEHESYGPEREHASKIQELVEEKIGDHEEEEDEKKIAESEIEAECDSLRKVDGGKAQELHEPKIHKERDKTRINGAEEPSCQEDKNMVEPLTIREDDNFVDVPEINKEQPDKLERQEKPYKIQEVVEARLNDHKEEEQEEKATAKAELETERESSKKVEETEQQKKYHGPKMRNSEEKKKNIAVEEKRTKTKDGSLKKVRDDEDQESSKPYKREIDDKTHELVEMGTSDYREKAKKQDENDILRSQEDLDEFERHGEQSNIPHLVEEEKVENIAELGRESYEDWTQEEREKRKNLVKEESADLKDKHTGVDDHIDDKQEKIIVNSERKTEEDSSKRVQETEKQDEDELQRSMAQDKMQETEEKDKTRAMEKNEIVERREKTINGSLRKVREDEEDPQLGKQKRHGEEDRIHELVVEAELNDHRGKVKKKDGDDVLRRSQETVKLDLGKRERHFKQRRIPKSVEEGEHEEEERYQKVSQAKTKVEHEINKKIGKNKDPEPEKQELYKSEAVLKEEVGDREKEEENLVDGSATKIQETEKEELEMYKKQDMVLDFVEDVTGDQKDEKAEEAAAVVASNANGSSRTVKTIEEESEEHMEKDKIPEISDPKVKETKEEVPKSRYVRDTKELEAHVPELEGKIENCKDDGQGKRAEKGKQGKIVESQERFKSRSDDGIVRKIQETKVQESNEKKNQEQKGKVEETVRRETSSHEVELVTEDDSLRKGQEFLEKESHVSKSGPVKQEKIQQLKKVKSQDHVNEDEEQELETKINNVNSSEEEEQTKIRKTMGEKSNAPEKEKEANEKIAEERMQDKTDSRTKNQEIKGEEPYKFIRNLEHDKIPEYHREEKKGMEQREIEEMKRTTEECSSRKVQKIKAQESFELEKHRKLSEIQESSNTQESVEKETQEHREEEMNERRGYNAVLKEKSMASSESQDVEEKGSDQPKRYAEQELMTKKERKEEIFVREGEQKEKAKRISQVDSKANDDSSIKNHQDLVEIEEGNVVGKAETVDEYASSRTIHEQEERNSDKLEGHGEEDMSKKLAEQGTSDDKESKEGNRAGEVWEDVETKIRSDSFGKVRQIEEEETDKKLSDVEKYIRGKSKETKNQETKRKDVRSGNKTQANEKQESHEQKRNEEEVIEKQETIEEHDSSRKIHEHNEQKSDTMSENIAEEETNDDKEGNRAGEVLGEVLKIRETEKQEQDKKKSFVDTSGKAKENKNQETKRTDDDSSGNKTQKQESHKKKSHHDQDKKNPGLIGKETNCFRNEDDVKEDKEIAEAEVLRKLKEIEKRESSKMVEGHENGDDIKELVEEKMNNKEEEEDKKSIVTDVLAKAEDDELRKQDKSREQRLGDNLKYEETSKTETKRKDNEHERIKEQGRIKELVEDRTHSCREKESKETEFEDSKKIQERDREESTEPGRNEKQDKIQEPVDRETSEDDEEELEIEFEDEEEDWEAEVIQVTDSDEDNDNIRQIKRIRLGFRLVGGSTLFMSLIVIVISFIRSKRKIRCYKF
ncbi:PREDICTED: trichohyalin [Camelina sativa]|uniref:Trichohyalin n=1 Tax=Camelina sativa TaxID=90675 RepID=A0ABM0SV64_CAMSA|nr:PREDICTED: trichohyalin [Camelina sativa]